MREMIFNEASVQIVVTSIHQIRPLLVDVARGMAGLVSNGVSTPILRMTNSWNGYRCATDGSLWDLLSLMLRERREVEETRFLMRLSTKCPLLVDLPDQVANRFYGCESADEGGLHNECLILCAHVFGIAISLPLLPKFDHDQLLICFREMAPDLLVNDVQETIDNLARSVHLSPILARWRQQLFCKLALDDLWTTRTLAFPHLTFGLDVEGQLRLLNPQFVSAVVKRLGELDEAAREWRKVGTSAPRWRSKVTPESEPVMNNERLKSYRMFRDSCGQATLFAWHARIGASHRIHLLFDRETFRVEVGYIGNHLPLA